MVHLQAKVAPGPFPSLTVFLLTRAAHGVEWDARSEPIIPYQLTDQLTDQLAEAVLTEILGVACQDPEYVDRSRETRY